MKTALAIIQEFCRLANINEPTAIVGETDPATLQLYEALRSALEDLRQARCWTVQKRKYTLTLQDGTSTYALPGDFFSMIPDTSYSDSTSRPLIPSSDADFAYKLYGLGGTPTDYMFRFFGPANGEPIEVYPTPSSEVDVYFEYLTGNLFLPANWTAADFTLHESLAADTDLVLFDADLAKLGLKAKFRDENAGDWQSAAQEFQAKIDAAVARLTGNVRGSFAAKRAGPRYQTQYRGWSL